MTLIRHVGAVAAAKVQPTSWSPDGLRLAIGTENGAMLAVDLRR